MRNFWFIIFFLNIGLLNAQNDSTLKRNTYPNISMELNKLNFGYTNSKKNNPNRSPEFFCSFLLTSYYSLYKSYSVSPVLGSTYYYWNDKKLTGDKIIYNGLFYGLGIEKKIKLSNHSDISFGIQRIYNETTFYSNRRDKSFESSNLTRFRSSFNAYVYKRFGLTSSINFVAYDKDEYTNILGSYRDLNFTFGFMFKLGGDSK